MVWTDQNETYVYKFIRRVMFLLCKARNRNFSIGTEFNRDRFNGKCLAKTDTIQDVGFIKTRCYNTWSASADLMFQFFEEVIKWTFINAGGSCLYCAWGGGNLQNEVCLWPPNFIASYRIYIQKPPIAQALCKWGRRFSQAFYYGVRGLPNSCEGNNSS